MAAPTSPPVAPGEPRTAALSRELSEFLVEFSIGVHRFSMYPANHPSLQPVVEGIIVHLAELLAGADSMAIGVANRQLIIEGVSTDRKHPVLSDLAKRLHEQQIGALTFDHGVRANEISGLFRTLAEAHEDETDLLGLREELPDWPHVHLHALGYDRLRLIESDGDGGSGSSSELWLGLARAVLAGGGQGGGSVHDPNEMDRIDPVVLAEEIEAKPQDAAYDQVISGYLRQLASELKGARGEEADRIRARVTSLVREMDEGTLSRLVQLGGDVQARQRFVLDTNQSLAVDAVVKVVRAAAEASGQEISTSMTRLLSKLSAHADAGAAKVRMQANSALRENVEELISEWELKDPNPDQYTRVLDSMAHASPVFRPGPLSAGLDRSNQEEELPGCVRILQMSLEVGAWGETVRTALIDAIALGRTAEILAMVEEVPRDNVAARKIRAHVTDPEQIRELLSHGDVDARAIEALIEEIGPEAAVPLLLDGMSESESRSVRRVVFDILVGVGDRAGPVAAERLHSEDRWFVQRNLIALLARLPTVPEGVDVVPFLSNREARVRREALPLAFRIPQVRHRALGLGLADEDERVCRMALHEIRERIPEAILPTFLNRVVKGDRPEEIRALAIRMLSGQRSKLVRDTLVELSGAGKSLLGRAKLAEGSPSVAAALKLMAAEWMDDAEARSLVEAARKSKEALLRRAVGAL